MGLRYRVPLPGPFYYSGRVGPMHWLPRSSHSGTGPMGFVVKWFIVYPSIVCFGAGLAIMVAPFYGLVLGGSSFSVEASEVSAGCSVFPCSVASAAVAGSAPRGEAVWLRLGSAAGSARPLWFRSGSAGACDCRE